jgi:2-polyprenyl-3-methyl-5-hydroxy-6-metoxy-1,4-benzoquinol methylase
MNPVDHHCRFCRSPLSLSFADLGMSPLSNAYLKPEQLNQMERFYPLHARVCEACFLVQLEEFESPERIFSDYAYFSSYSDSWLQHAARYAEQMTDRFGFNERSHVVEIASNDGYLLQYFVARGIRVLGIEPAANVAEAAQQKGVPTLVRFFGTALARELAAAGKGADLLLGNNVLAHVPDLNDFVAGMAVLLNPGGVITMEFPHIMRLMAENQFDTIYHEHFSYFSFLTAEKVFAAHGITLFDAEEISTHGGSLRVFGRRAADTNATITSRVSELRAKERAAGLDRAETYAAFGEQVKATKRALLRFLMDRKEEGRKVVGYGAPAKGNTLLNYCGVRTDLLDYTVDRSPHKQGLFLPGTHIPIFAPDRIAATRPDYVLILPWNLKTEIMEQMAHVRAWGAKFVVPIPSVEVLD